MRRISGDEQVWKCGGGQQGMEGEVMNGLMSKKEILSLIGNQWS